MKRALVAVLSVAVVWGPALAQSPDSSLGFHRSVPKAWDDAELASMDLPLAGLGLPPVHVAAEWYYRQPVRQFPKSYPVYHPSKEPPGYMDWLQKQERQAIAFDPASFKTAADWIRAGEVVFNFPRFGAAGPSLEDLRSRAWYEATGVKFARDGVVPGVRYIIVGKGQVEAKFTRCSSCHTRVLPDGDLVTGAQGNMPVDFLAGYRRRQVLQKGAAGSAPDAQLMIFRTTSVPWLTPDPAEPVRRMSFEDLASAQMSIPAGVALRFGTSLFYPPKIPDLIGVKDRAYLDATGLVRNRSIGDLMRYAELVEGIGAWNRYGEYSRGDSPAASAGRLGDEQLYALGLYLYSLKAPHNPNGPSPTTIRGEAIFHQEGCDVCHTPPNYSNNKLTPAFGFVVPEDHKKRYSIMPISVGTDPRLAMHSRKGTGYYRVPSLKGVWYRGPFEHNGSVATLEDWFDPARLRDDYIPTGFKGFGIKTRAVKGHEFGLKLTREDKVALIAFLKTL